MNSRGNRKKKTNIYPPKKAQNTPTEQILKDGNKNVKKIRFTSLILFSIIILFALIYLLVEVFAPDNSIYFEKVDIPNEFINKGISEDFIKSNIIFNIKNMNDSSLLKINQLLNSELDTQAANSPRSLEMVLSSASQVLEGKNNIELGGGGLDLHITGLVKSLRKHIAKKNDLYIKLHFLCANNQVSISIAVENVSNISNKKFVCKFDESSDVNQIFNELTLLASGYICKHYNPITSVLFDYKYTQGYEVYEGFAWQDRLYTADERERLLLSKKDDPNPYISKWSNILLGNIYETKGIINRNQLDLKNAINYYKSSLSKDFDVLSPSLSPKIKRIEESLEHFKQDDNYSHLLLKTLLKYNMELSNSTQLIVVFNNNRTNTKATMLTFEKKDSIWETVFPSLDVNLGARGFAKENQKMEGDYRTPCGLYSITKVFGYKNDITTKMHFIELSSQHIWITDANEPEYNQIVTDTNNQYRNKGEILLRMDILNKYGIIIDYNTNPIEKGKGSAIFIHCERSKTHKTAGCISLPENEMKKLIEWLDPEKQPFICMGSIADF